MVEKTSTTAERLRYIIETENIKQADILERCLPYLEQFKIRMNRSDISQYVAGKATPKQNKLYILARALNVSEAWLMGYDVEKERQERPEPVSPAAAYKVELEKVSKNFSQRQMQRLLEYARMLDLYKDGD